MACLCAGGNAVPKGVCISTDMLTAFCWELYHFTRCNSYLTFICGCSDGGHGCLITREPLHLAQTASYTSGAGSPESRIRGVTSHTSGRPRVRLRECYDQRADLGVFVFRFSRSWPRPGNRAGCQPVGVPEWLRRRGWVSMICANRVSAELGWNGRERESLERGQPHQAF